MIRLHCKTCDRVIALDDEGEMRVRACPTCQARASSLQRLEEKPVEVAAAPVDPMPAAPAIDEAEEEATPDRKPGRKREG